MQIEELLLCVGAQKSGTTWLYNRLSEHSQMRTASHKELHYFSTVHCGGMMGPKIKMNAIRRIIDRHPEKVLKFIQSQATGQRAPRDVSRIFRPMNDNWYAGVFQKDGRYAMDFTPEYARLPDEAHDHIKRISKRQRIIFIMREPVERALSAVRYVFQQKGRDIKIATEDEILDVARKPIIIELSQYNQTVNTIERNYKPQDVRFLFYESVMKEKSQALADICDWLEIDRLDLPPEDVEKSDNATQSFEIPCSTVDYLSSHLKSVRIEIEKRFPQAVEAWQYKKRDEGSN